MTTRDPRTRRDYISDAILWLKDALDEDHDYGEDNAGSDFCLRRAMLRVTEARASVGRTD
jgi:hypothetical protein